MFDFCEDNNDSVDNYAYIVFINTCYVMKIFDPNKPEYKKIHRLSMFLKSDKQWRDRVVKSGQLYL